MTQLEKEYKEFHSRGKTLLQVIVTGNILLVLLFSCQKAPIIIRQAATIISGKLVSLQSDTTIQGVWDGGGKVLRINDYRIKGTGTLQNWIIDAAYTQWIFDTSINLVNIKVYGEAFSAVWYGASSYNIDNYRNIQKSINICKNNFPLYIPKGNYKYSQSLTASTLYKGLYTATKLDLYGDGDIWSDATTLTYTGVTGFGFGIHYAKGGSIHNIKFQGQFVSPVNNGMAYYNLTDDQYRDASGRTSIGYSGIVIDYDGSLNTGGSTGLKVTDVWVSGFDILYNISPNGKTFNADILIFTNIRCGDGRIGIQSGQAQEKGNVINYIASWGNLHTLISIGNSGKYQAGSYTINDGNIAGNCIRLFNIRLAGWNPFSVKSLKAEGIATLGTITTGDSRYTPIASLNDLRVRFALQAQAGIQTLLTANSYNVKISNSTLWYYGAPQDTLTFSGKATMDNCNYSGAIKWI